MALMQLKGHGKSRSYIGGNGTKCFPIPRGFSHTIRVSTRMAQSHIRQVIWVFSGQTFIAIAANGLPVWIMYGWHFRTMMMPISAALQ